MNNENKMTRFDITKKKVYGILGICILAIILFFVYKFQFGENHVVGRESCEGIITEEENTATIKVNAWMPMGFSGYVIETGQKEIFEENSLIKVQFNEDVEVIYANGEKFEYHEEEANAGECLIKIGSLVQVKYHAYESVKRNGDADRIYVEKVRENRK